MGEKLNGFEINIRIMPEKFERENLDSSENQPEDLKEQGPVLSDQEMAEIERKANEAKESEPQTSEELTEKIEKLKKASKKNKLQKRYWLYCKKLLSKDKS